MSSPRREATRDAIVRNALRLFAERGYAAVRVEDIVRAAGVSRATFYNHFAEREDILGALFERLLATEGDAPELGSDDLPPLCRVRVLARDAARRMLAQEDLARFLYRLPVRHESLLRPDAASTPGVFREIHRLLDQAAERGEIRTDVPVEVMCIHVHNALEAGMRAWAEGGTDDPASRVDVLVDLALNGVVRSDDGRRPVPAGSGDEHVDAAVPEPRDVGRVR